MVISAYYKLAILYSQYYKEWSPKNLSAAWNEYSFAKPRILKLDSSIIRIKLLLIKKKVTNSTIYVLILSFQYVILVGLLPPPLNQLIFLLLETICEAATVKEFKVI